MATLTLGVPVRGTDQPIGRLTALVCDPGTDEVTHLVVNADDVVGSERLVPIGLVDDRDADPLTLTVTRHQYFGLDTFEIHRFHQSNESDVWHLPFELGDDTLTYAPHERIPASDVALRRGTRVYDRDHDRIGRVHGFVVDPATHDITHLVLQHGHVFAHDVKIPVTDIAKMSDDGIYLDVTAAEIAGRRSVQR